MTDAYEPGSKRSGGWLPPQAALEAWLEALDERAAARGDDAALHPSLQNLRELIDRDPVLRLTFNEMLEQVPGGRAYASRHLQSVDHLFALVNEVLTTAPEFNESSMVGTPLNAVLDCQPTVNDTEYGPWLTIGGESVRLTDIAACEVRAPALIES